MNRAIVFLNVFFITASIFALDISQDGKALSDIVIAADAPKDVRAAAHDLAMFIEKISGAKLNVVSTPGREVKNHICVGESDYTRQIGYKAPKINGSGYDILVRGNVAVLSGPMMLEPEKPAFDIHYKDNWYLHRLCNQFTPPEGFPHEGLKKWWAFCGKENFSFFSPVTPGWILKNNGGFAIANDVGPWHAVSALLESLGVRFYSPGQDGTIIPQNRNISLKDGRRTREAAFSRREFTGIMEPETLLWTRRMKMGTHNRLIWNHTLPFIYANPLQRAKHPEWLSETAPGKPLVTPYPRDGRLPRYTDPAFREAVLLWMRKELDAHPWLAGINVGQQDGKYQKFDYRDRPRYVKPGISEDQAWGDYSFDLVVYVARGLKKSHPGKYVLFGGSYEEPPFPTRGTEDFPDNLVCEFSMWGWPALPGTNKTELQASYPGALDMFRKSKTRNQWIARLPRGVKGPYWEHYLYYRNKVFYPVYFTKYLQEQMQELRRYCDGKFIELDGNAQGLANLPLMQWTLYVQNKLFWDPDLDLDKLLDEYCRLYFGPAHAEMKEYHQFAESVWCRPEKRLITAHSGFLKEKDIDRFFALIEKAKQKTKDQPVCFNRVAALEKSLLPLKKLFANLKRSNTERVHLVLLDSTAKPDGNVAKYHGRPCQMRDLQTGGTVLANATEVRCAMTRDQKYLACFIRCSDMAMDRVKASCRKADDASIWNDDVVEFFVETPERSHFQVVVNSAGVTLEQTTDLDVMGGVMQPLAWGKGVKTFVRKTDSYWDVELWIPTADFGSMKRPTREYPWGIQVGRSFSNPKRRTQAVAPTGGGYIVKTKWANLY